MHKARHDTAMNDTKFKELPNEAYFAIIAQQLESCGRATVRVTGTSMRPFLHPEIDDVELEPYCGGMKRGDLVLYRSGSIYILHRVSVPGDMVFSMRGDNNASAETGLPVEGIVGIVASVCRSGRLISRGSPMWRLYALLGSVNHAGKILWHKILRPVLARVYHAVVDRGTKGV